MPGYVCILQNIRDSLTPFWKSPRPPALRFSSFSRIGDAPKQHSFSDWLVACHCPTKMKIFHRILFNALGLDQFNYLINHCLVKVKPRRIVSCFPFTTYLNKEKQFSLMIRSGTAESSAFKASNSPEFHHNTNKSDFRTVSLLLQNNEVLPAFLNRTLKSIKLFIRYTFPQKHIIPNSYSVIFGWRPKTRKKIKF